MKKTAAIAIKVIGVCLLAIIFVYIYRWFPVVDRIANHCQYYSKATIDCQQP